MGMGMGIDMGMGNRGMGSDWEFLGYTVLIGFFFFCHGLGMDGAWTWMVLDGVLVLD
jgi:hypothetical protein